MLSLSAVRKTEVALLRVLRSCIQPVKLTPD